MTAVAGLMRLTRKRTFTRPEGGQRLLERPKGPSAPPAAITKRVRVRTTRSHGVDVHRVTRDATTGDDRPVVIYLHGGAYVNEIAPQHWSLVATIATRVDVEVRVPIYGLAPEHHALEALELVTGLLEELAETGRPCYLMGDSAGAGLALIAAQQAAGRDTTLRGLTLMAPWLDLSMSNPEVDVVERRDPWLARAALHTVAAAWAGGLSLRDPRVSPLFGPVEQLPPVDLWVGTRDITLPDVRLLRDRLAEHDLVTYHEEPGAIHVFPLLPVPEGRAAQERIIEHLRGRLLVSR